MTDPKIGNIAQFLENNAWKPKDLGTKAEIVTPYREPVPVGKASQIQTERAQAQEKADKARKEAEEVRAGQFEELQDKAYKTIGFEALEYIRNLKGMGYSPSDIKINKNTITVKNYAIDKEGNMTNKVVGQSVTTYNSKGEEELHVDTRGNERITHDYRPKKYMIDNTTFPLDENSVKRTYLGTAEEKVNGSWVVKDKWIRVRGTATEYLIRDGKSVR